MGRHFRYARHRRIEVYREHIDARSTRTCAQEDARASEEAQAVLEARYDETPTAVRRRSTGNAAAMPDATSRPFHVYFLRHAPRLRHFQGRHRHLSSRQPRHFIGQCLFVLVNAHHHHTEAPAVPISAKPFTAADISPESEIDERAFSHDDADMTRIERRRAELINIGDGDGRHA